MALARILYIHMRAVVVGPQCPILYHWHRGVRHPLYRVSADR